MRPDEFGGFAIRITHTAIRSMSTWEWLAEQDCPITSEPTDNGSPPAESAAEIPIVVIEVAGGVIDAVDATKPTHVIITDWDVPDEATGKKPTRSISYQTQAERCRVTDDIKHPAVRDIDRDLTQVGHIDHFVEVHGKCRHIAKSDLPDLAESTSGAIFGSGGDRGARQGDQPATSKRPSPHNQRLDSNRAGG
jgi:hypothetical protein